MKSENGNTKKRFPISIILVVAVVCLGVFSGAIIGKSYVGKNGGDKVDYSAYSESELRGSDLADAKNAYTKQSLKDYVESADNGAALLFVLAESNSLESGNFDCKSTGTVLASIANQQIFGHTVVADGKVYGESISKGLMNVANMYKFDGEKVIMTKGKDVAALDNGEMSANFDGGDTVAMSREEYIDRFGGMGGICNYIVSVKTIKSVDKTEYGTDEKGDYAIIKFTLDENTSSLNYAKNVKATSDLKELPTFSSVEVEAKIYSDYKIHQLTVKEKYTIKYTDFLTPECVGDIVSEIEYGNAVYPN